MPSEAASPFSTIKRIERALVLLAYFIELDGDIHVPMYEKFEAELRGLQATEDTKIRARQRLLSYCTNNSHEVPRFVLQPGSIASPVCVSTASQCTGIPSAPTE